MENNQEKKPLEIVEQNENYIVYKNPNGLYQIVIEDETDSPIMLVAEKYNRFGDRIYYVNPSYGTLYYIDLKTLKHEFISQRTDYKIKIVDGKKLLLTSRGELYDEAGNQTGTLDLLYATEFFEKDGKVYLKDYQDNLGTRLFTIRRGYETRSLATTTSEDNAVFNRCIDSKTGKEKLYDILGRVSTKETKSGKEIYNFYHDENMKTSDLTTEFLADDNFYNAVVSIVEQRIKKLVEQNAETLTKRDKNRINAKLKKTLTLLEINRKKAIITSKIKNIFTTTDVEINI